MATMGPLSMSSLLLACLSNSIRFNRSLTGDEAGEEGLAGEVSVVLLKVLLGGGGELQGSELEAIGG